MAVEKIRFRNQEAMELVGQLEMPLDQHPHNYVIFSHCFTCGKNLTAIRLISRELAAQGFAVLRFDFTGLGESDGDFADTNFSSNVGDLVAAAEYLQRKHAAPSILIGHSFGGTAALMAAANIDSIKAVATIAAPSEPQHVQHLLQQDIAEINQTGQAVVNLAGRQFTIKQQFLEDLQQQSMSELIHQLRKPLLVMHSPQDDTVAISNAENIYRSAVHPKSFVTLDQADHLLSKADDARYTGQVIAGWARRYVDIPEPSSLSSSHQVAARLAGDTFTTYIQAKKHALIADEPLGVGGNDFGPSPYELLSSSLAACTVMTIKMYARRKGWDVQQVEVHTNHNKDYNTDCETCQQDDAGSARSKIDVFSRQLRIEGNLDQKQRQRLLEIADRCPVHRTLHSQVMVNTELLD